MHMDRVVAAWEAGKDRIFWGAPHVVVAHAPKDERTAPAACTIALTYGGGPGTAPAACQFWCHDVGLSGIQISATAT
jgi:hypothetical protein